MRFSAELVMTLLRWQRRDGVYYRNIGPNIAGVRARRLLRGHKQWGLAVSRKLEREREQDWHQAGRRRVPTDLEPRQRCRRQLREGCLTQKLPAAVDGGRETKKTTACNRDGFLQDCTLLLLQNNMKAGAIPHSRDNAEERLSPVSHLKTFALKRWSAPSIDPNHPAQQKCPRHAQ